MALPSSTVTRSGPPGVSTATVPVVRPDGKVGKLSQPGQPDRLVALARREVRDCLAEELRRLDPDEIYGAALAGIAKISRGRTPISPMMNGAAT